MTKRIIFQDVDGPLIPYRMYGMTRDRVFDLERGCFIYDPVAVALVNSLCEQLECKVVYNTAHGINPPEVLLYQAKCNDLKYLHQDHVTEYPRSESRLHAINNWLAKHPEVTEWIVIDDLLVHDERQVMVNYEIGITLDDFKKAWKLFTGGEPDILPFISMR